MDLQENMNLAAKAFAEGKLQEAHDLFSKCSEQTQNPKAVCVILTNKGATLQRMGKLQDSLVVFAEALAKDSTYYQAFFNQGISYKGLGKFEKAVESFEKVLELNPTEYAAMCGLCETWNCLQKYDKALEYANKAIVADPKNSLGYLDRAFTYLKMKNFQAAIEDYETSGSESEESIRLLSIALSYQGQAFDKEEKYEEAIKMFDRVLVLQPNENRFFSKAVVLYKMNRISEAAVVFRQVLKLNPENYKSCAALGTILCEQNEFAEAATLLEKVYESKEYQLLDKKSVLQNLGLAYIKAGKVEKGQKAFEELLKEDPSNKTAVEALKIMKSSDLVKEVVEIRKSKPPTENVVATTTKPAPKKEIVASPAVAAPSMDTVIKKKPPPIPTAATTSKLPTGAFFALEKLQAPGPFPAGVDVAKREEFLDDSEFSNVFSMTKANFFSLPRWKQTSLKKEVGLF